MNPSLLARLIPELRRHFPDRPFQPGTPPNSVLTFPAKHPDVGAIEIHDDGNELTLYLGNFTHSHISNYDEGISDDDKAKEIIESAVAFLSEVFNDRVIFWGSHKGGGGSYHVSITEPKPGSNEPRFVWSGPYSAG